MICEDAAEHEPFDFDRSHPLTLESLVYQAIGAASMCWTNMRGAGEFDSARAIEVAEALLREIRKGD
jgi:hypothetical protein